MFRKVRHPERSGPSTLPAKCWGNEVEGSRGASGNRRCQEARRDPSTSLRSARDDRGTAFARIFLFVAQASGLALTLWVSTALAVSPDFAAANHYYDEGKFDDARQLYEALVQKREYTPNLFYNLGNAEWRLDHPGFAALDYERALALEPSHPEARANLVFVREKTGAKIEGRSWLEHALVRLPGGEYAILAAVAAWVALFGFTAAILRPGGRRGALVTAFFGLIVGAYATVSAYYSESDSSLAIITAKRAEARMAPADNSALADSLPAGSRVQIIAERGPWVYCVLPNRQSAWISGSAVERVPPAGA